MNHGKSSIMGQHRFTWPMLLMKYKKHAIYDECNNAIYHVVIHALVFHGARLDDNCHLYFAFCNAERPFRWEDATTGIFFANIHDLEETHMRT
jgi:hypothetical protein